MGVEGIERKWRVGEEVARQMYLWVGDTEIDHNGGEGMGYVDCISASFQKESIFFDSD